MLCNATQPAVSSNRPWRIPAIMVLLGLCFGGPAARAHDGEPVSFRGEPVMMLRGSLVDTLNIQGDERMRLS